MPRTRHDIERDQKVAEIVDAAVARLTEGGYDTLSVAAIARELKLAQNALYWYFPSKDHLFVAALERMMRDIVARKPGRQRTVEAKVLWFVEQLQELEHVRSGMYERARKSPVVAEFVEALEATWHRMLSNVLAHQLPERDLAPATDALIATIQGSFLRPLSTEERRRLIRFALERLTR